MKFVIGAAVIAVAVILLGQMAGFKFGIPSANQRRAESRLIGRWDQVGANGYIRFTDYGWFRSVINGKKREGQFQLCPGSAIEFTVTYDVQDRLTKKKWTEREIWESKFSLNNNTLKLQLDNRWIEFERATDPPAESPVATPTSVVPAAPPTQGARASPVAPKNGANTEGRR